MPQIINLPEGGTATFPDNMPQGQIESVLQEHYKANPVKTAPSVQESLDAKASSKPTDFPSKALAATGGFIQGALKGPAQVITGIPNVIQSGIESGLNLLAKHGIVSDSLAQRYASGRKNINEAEASFGKKIMDFQGQPSVQDRAANPNISKYSEMAGNAVGSSLAAGGIVGDLGKGMAAVPRMAVNQGGQGVLMGASADQESPIKGAAIGGAIGGVLGGLVGHFDRSAQIINDRMDHAAKLGYGPYSEQAIKSTKEALDNAGKDLSTEELQAQAKKVVQAKLDGIAPSVEFSDKAPADMVVNMAKTNFGEVRKARDALYAPLNESTAVAETPTLTETISNLKTKSAQAMIPDQLPQNATLSDLMTYRKQVSAAINQSERALKMGNASADFKALDELHQVKNAVTQDLETTASKVGLADQLQKADSFHAINYKPFEVYNKSGKLVSDMDTSKAWDKVSRLLKARFPNTAAMSQVAQTLGPEGKQVFGYAYLQNTVNKVMDVEERLQGPTLAKELNKVANMGIDRKIFTPQVQEAFNGLRAIAEGATKVSKMVGNDLTKQGAIAGFINKLTHNSAGITMLRSLGSKTTPPAQIKNLVGQILLNATEKQAVSALPEDKQ